MRTTKRQQRIDEVVSIIKEANQLNSLEPEELEYLRGYGFDPGKRHNVIRSVVHTTGDRKEADRISAVMNKLPDHAATHVIIDVVQPPNATKATD